jgi:hypothetical protein
VKTIKPMSVLPEITDPVIIDGTTQPGFSGSPIIELNGTNVGTFKVGLTITAGSSTVRGLVINRYSTTSIIMETNGNNIIEGNFMGTDVAGTAALGNSIQSVWIESANNLIGGTTASARNVISAKDSEGVIIVSAEATGNKVQGNYIGTDVTGTVPLGSAVGIAVNETTSNNTVGGTTAGARNIISGNSERGVRLDGGVMTLVQGNFIGTDVTGTKPLGSEAGIEDFGGGNNTVGGTAAGARNIISGNSLVGVALSASLMTLVQGNFIGTDVSGTKALGNVVGIEDHLGGNNTVGGTAAGARNIISANVQGLRIVGSGMTLVQGNFIGTDVSGTIALGNSATGVLMAGPSCTVGGTTSGAGNRIAYNGGDGVLVGDFDFPSFDSTANAILSNSIFSNAGLGINLCASFDDDDQCLDATDVTPNDLNDADTGPNNLQNYPVLSSAIANSSGSVTIQGVLTSAPGDAFTIQFFSNSGCDPSGHGEGQKFLGSTVLATNAAGIVTFTVTLPGPVVMCSGSTITATATDTGGNTSEFSPCKLVTGQYCPDIDIFPIPFDLGIIPKDTFVNKLLTVRNKGTAPLMVTPIYPPDPVSPFQLVSPTEPFTLQRGQRRSLTVRFRPRMAGQFHSMMMIQSNDPMKPVVNVELMGASCSPPMLTPLPGTIQMKFDTMKDIPLAVMDGQAYCQYKFSISPALRFATLTDKKDGTGMLRLAPGRLDVGTYRLTVMVSDGSSPPQTSSQMITITVTR